MQPRSKIFPVIRLRKLTKERWRCQACPETLVSQRQVHHIKPVSRFRSLELVEENLVVLCPDCHATVHKIMRTPLLRQLIALAEDARFLKGCVFDFGAVPQQLGLAFSAPAANEEAIHEVPPAETA